MTTPQNSNPNYAALTASTMTAMAAIEMLDKMRRELNEKLLIIERKRELRMKLTKEERAIYLLYGKPE